MMVGVRCFIIPLAQIAGPEPGLQGGEGSGARTHHRMASLATLVKEKSSRCVNAMPLTPQGVMAGVTQGVDGMLTHAAVQRQNTKRVLEKLGYEATKRVAEVPMLARTSSVLQLVGKTKLSMHEELLDQIKGGPFPRARAAVYRILERPRSSWVAFALCAILLGAILISIFTYCLSTEEELADSVALGILEWLCNFVFTVEFALRLFSMPSLRFLLRDWSIYIDLLSLLPFYVDVAIWANSGDSFEAFGRQLGDEQQALTLLRLLRLLRILKLLRHYSGWRVLILALENSWRPILVPVFALVVAIVMLGGMLEYVRSSIDEDPDCLEYSGAFAAMWQIFWLVTSLSAEGTYKRCSPWTRICIAIAICAGVLLTTMPITIIGNAFAEAWEKKEMIEVALQIRELLAERGLELTEVETVFNEFDISGDGMLDFYEFRYAGSAKPACCSCAQTRGPLASTRLSHPCAALRAGVR